MVFFDTNIFIYVVSGAPADRPNREIAQRLMMESAVPHEGDRLAEGGRDGRGELFIGGGGHG